MPDQVCTIDLYSVMQIETKVRYCQVPTNVSMVNEVTPDVSFEKKQQKQQVKILPKLYLLVYCTIWP